MFFSVRRDGLIESMISAAVDTFAALERWLKGDDVDVRAE
jgi:hypothetical protein